MERIHSFALIAGLAKRRVVFAGAIAAAVALVGTKVLADDASDIEQFYTTGQVVTYDNTSGDYPVITAIPSYPGVTGGHTYTGWSILAQDSTGSLDLFASAFTITNLTGSGAGSPYTSSSLPAVGDKVNMQGTWSPFDQIPELTFTTVAASNQYLRVTSRGNAVPTAPAFTVSQINIPNISNHIEFAGTLIELTNAVISTTNALTAFPGYTNNVSAESMYVNDSSGAMTLFDWTTSYSGAAALQGTPITTSPVNIYGFVDAFGSTAEFVPLSIVAVPEPSSIALIGVGVVGLFAMRRRRK